MWMKAVARTKDDGATARGSGGAVRSSGRGDRVLVGLDAGGLGGFGSRKEKAATGWVDRAAEIPKRIWWSGGAAMGRIGQLP